MMSNHIAIIGLDAQFGQQDNIDRVERALYLGKEMGRGIGKKIGEDKECGGSAQKG